MISMICQTIRMCEVQYSISGMTDIKLECLLLSSGPSWYTIVMLIMSSLCYVFRKTIYLNVKWEKSTQ